MKTTVKRIEPYGYQLEFIEDINYCLSNKSAILGVLPTGGGKTVVAAMLIQSWLKQSKRILYIAHKEELVFQPWRTLYRNFGIESSIIKAGFDSSYNLPVQIASIPSMQKRPFPFSIDYIIIDEAHHVVSETYLELIKKARSLNPNVKILGLTATPKRNDGIALGNVFEEMVLGPTTMQLESMGFLCSPKVVVSPIKPSIFNKLKITKTGDYSSKLTTKIMNTPLITDYAIGVWEKYARHLPTAIFCNSVEHSKAVASAFQKKGYNIRHIDGGNNKDVRRSVKANMINGNLLGVSNCMLLVEGVDIPNIQCIMDLQITASVSLHRQKGGRGSRLFTDEVTKFVKKNYIYLDFVNATFKHGSPNCNYKWSLEGEDLAAKSNKKGEINPDGVILKMMNSKGISMAVSSCMLNEIIGDTFLEGYSVVSMTEDEQRRLAIFNRVLRSTLTKGEKRRYAFNSFKEYCVTNLEFPTPFELQYIQQRASQTSRFSKPWWQYWHEQIQREIERQKRNTRMNTYKICIQGNNEKLSLTTIENEFSQSSQICYIYEVPRKAMRDATLKWWSIKSNILEIAKTDIWRASKNIQFNMIKIEHSKLIYATKNFEDEIKKFLENE